MVRAILMKMLILGLLLCGWTACDKDDPEELPNEEIDEVYDAASFTIFDDEMSSGEAMAKTADGGYIITGSAGGDAGLIKLDAEGQRSWVSTFGGNQIDLGRSVIQTETGAYVFAGRTNSFGQGDSDAYIVQTDEGGNEQWTSTYGTTENEFIQGIVETPDGGFLLVGNVRASVALTSDLLTLRLDEQGDMIWQKTFDFGTEDLGFSIRKSNDGSYLVPLLSSQDGQSGRLSILKLSLDSSIIWSKEYPDLNWEYHLQGVEIRQTADGGYVLVGTTYSEDNGGNANIRLLKLDADGTVEWEQTYGGVDYEEGASVLETVDGYLVLGTTRSYGNGSFDLCLIKTQKNGERVWFNTYGGDDEDNAFDIVETGNGGYAICGYSFDFDTGRSKMIFLRVDDEGRPQ